MSVHSGFFPAVRPRGAVRPERCELCGTPVAARHGHVVDTGRRGLLCSCRACFLLFTRCVSGEARYRAVPERYLWDPGHPVACLDWRRLDVPAGFAFVLHRGTRVTAFQPGPAGAVETVLPLDLWADLTAGHPLLAAAEPEVEAIVFRGTDRITECFLVPVDACYRLVGAVRRSWSGPDGGPEMRARVGELFAEIQRRARPLCGGAD
ncbi:hypothetical protein Amsp01_060930 [Amycolatopsis sp. NBRC 101858]|uniref:DUF5947 family protein n=1 Tax=Amycolatopsis sp. NBRC 101858 TaxID=3032200 RepID=UPI0024A5E6FD|nr:DUF5947 family protein [Amycolatopsis sp. NBRC 101858]GLY40070.1 hypothetical protein Amsp01_060930 [Amycolatopsis sp. NBRC 101858]